MIAGWTLPLPSPVIWTMFVLATIAVPPLMPVLLTGLIPYRRGISKRSHVRAIATDLVLAASHVALTVTLLADQAWLMTDAIVRTLSRVYVTRRKLLEWVTAAQAKAGFDLSLSSFYRRMGGTVAIAAAVAILVASQPPEVRWIAVPFAILWALSPMVAYWISLPPRAAAAQPLSADDVRMLRLTARRLGGSSNLCRPGRPRASSRQFSGNADTGRGPSHLTDQRRAVSALHHRGARFRLDRHSERN